MKVEKIQVVDRYRLDLGDVSDLATSIAIHGLMHPIVVTPEGRLIAGHRRLEAIKALGWQDVPVTFIENVTDAADLLRMERDENICRKDMTPSEKVALGRKLEELERPKAEAARLAGNAKGGRAEVSVRANGDFRDVRREGFDVREVVAPAVDMSTATYSRAKQLVTAAEAGDEQAAAAVEQMDRTGKVTPAYEDWKKRPVNLGKGNAETSRDTFGIGAEKPEPIKGKGVKKFAGRKPIAAMNGAINTLSGLCSPMESLTADSFADLSEEERTRWVSELSKALSTLRRVRDLIKE